MSESMSITDFRREISPVFSEAVQRHRPAKVRRNHEEGVLISAEDLAVLVRHHEFHPRVFREDGTVNIWLPEFSLYGRGSSLAEAKADLIEEVTDYVLEYLDEATLYMRAPNRAHHFPHVVKAFLARSPEDLEAMLFAEPAQETSPSSARHPAEAVPA